MKNRSCVALAAIAAAVSLPSAAETISPLFARGFTVLPTPQKVDLGAKDFEFGEGWRVELTKGMKRDDAAAEDLSALMAERFHLRFSKGGPGVLRLAIAPNSVAPAGSRDKDSAALADQAYRLQITPQRITITGNTETGLFYGVQTLVQLVKQQDGKLWLPEAEIEDWPDLEMRIIYWDDAHHLEKLDVLKAALRQAAFYKINGFSIKLEGHYEFKHAPSIVEPYALTPAEFQELTDYGLKYHVEVIPYLDAPAHDAFILKHPEYAAVREYADNNYEFCATNPQTYELLQGMFEDLLAGNKGGKYFVLSTDEPYYVGLANNANCKEADRAKQLGSVGKLLAEFVTKTAGYLHDHGRKVIFWGEYPMKPDDVSSLPDYLINGEVYGPEFDPVFRAHGIRQMVYTYMEAEEQLFPHYYLLPSAKGAGRVKEMVDSISFTSLASLSSTRPDSAHSEQANLMGVFVAGWGDEGLHPETFWLGYATGPAAAWHRGEPGADELQSSFYSLFYGPGATDMGKLYQLMSEGAQFWESSWEKGPSTARKPIWGNSFGQFTPPRAAHDQYLPPLPVPSTGLLHVDRNWRTENRERIDQAGLFVAQNAQLLDLLHANELSVQFNRYSLEVYLSIAGIYRQNLLMLQDLGRISDALSGAESLAGKSDAVKAVGSLDLAIDIAENIRESRNKALQDATATWSQSWLPRVSEANGRVFLNEVDDVKDHPPVRTVDMSYLVYRELLYPMGAWVSKVIAVRNEYAIAHQLSTRKIQIDWSNVSDGVTTAHANDPDQ